jgi:hypothetical protein
MRRIIYAPRAFTYANAPVPMRAVPPAGWGYSPPRARHVRGVYAGNHGLSGFPCSCRVVKTNPLGEQPTQQNAAALALFHKAEFAAKAPAWLALDPLTKSVVDEKWSAKMQARMTNNAADNERMMLANLTELNEMAVVEKSSPTGTMSTKDVETYRGWKITATNLDRTTTRYIAESPAGKTLTREAAWNALPAALAELKGDIDKAEGAVPMPVSTPPQMAKESWWKSITDMLPTLPVTPLPTPSTPAPAPTPAPAVVEKTTIPTPVIVGGAALAALLLLRR